MGAQGDGNGERQRIAGRVGSAGAPSRLRMLQGPAGLHAELA